MGFVSLVVVFQALFVAKRFPRSFDVVCKCMYRCCKCAVAKLSTHTLASPSCIPASLLAVFVKSNRRPDFVSQLSNFSLVCVHVCASKADFSINFVLGGWPRMILRRDLETLESYDGWAP